MDFVLVFPLILTSLFTGQSYAELTRQTNGSCYAKCQAGYHKVGECQDEVAKHRCEKCAPDTFTDRENEISECERCKGCPMNEVEISPCSFKSDVTCDCKKGYYYKGSPKKKCHDCSGKSKEYNADYMRKCRPCQRNECLKDPKCKKKCSTASPTSLNLSTSTNVSTVLSMSTTTVASRHEFNPQMDPVQNDAAFLTHWLVVGLLGIVLVVFCLSFLLKNPHRYPKNCFRASDPKLSVKDPKRDEQGSHQDGDLTTLTFTISEEIPMMTLSPVTPECPESSHVSPLLPVAEHKAWGQRGHWPPVVLYAIIREVPLRRWKEFLRLLSLADHQLERVEMEAGLGQGSMETQYQMLRLWSQCPSASLDDVFSALRYMDLSGCGQLLQESLEELQWRPTMKKGAAAALSYRSDNDNQGSNEAVPDPWEAATWGHE